MKKMAVYVDDMKAKYGRMTMCHMMADTTEELFAMADQIGVARRWLQKPGSYQEHFDVALSKRALAVEAGAVEVTKRELGAFMILRRDNSSPETLAFANRIWVAVSNRISASPDLF